MTKKFTLFQLSKPKFGQYGWIVSFNGTYSEFRQWLDDRGFTDSVTITRERMSAFNLTTTTLFTDSDAVAVQLKLEAT